MFPFVKEYNQAEWCVSDDMFTCRLNECCWFVMRRLLQDVLDKHGMQIVQLVGNQTSDNVTDLVWKDEIELRLNRRGHAVLTIVIKHRYQ